MTTAHSGIRAAGLPAFLTPFVGRQREIATVAMLVRRDDVRLLTLAGTGGVGKTRLAVRIAEEIAATFADGVAFVPLAAIRDPDLVAAAIAQILGLEAAGEEPLNEQLAGHLRERELLLILDNFEHIAAAAPLLADLLGTAPRLKLLVTSRSVLRLSGERVVTVPPLALPGAGSADLAAVESVRLFVDRAQAARADFALSTANAAAVAEVCARLDGLPLAIELAAARVSSLPPSALLPRMERRLPFLTSGARDAPSRQQTMRAAIAWSHDLLSPDEQTLFHRLSVFVGDFALDGAEFVGGEGDNETGGQDQSDLSVRPPIPLASSVIDGITALVEHSLLSRAHRIAGEPRYLMLDTIREFGVERLTEKGELAAARDAHAAYLLALAVEAEQYLFGPDQVAWLDRLELELPNLRAALTWLRERGRVDEGLRLTASPGRFWWRRGYLSEGRSWLDAFLAQPADAPSSHRVKALIVAGDIAAWQKDREQAATRHSEAAALSRSIGDTWGLAMALFGLGSDAVDRGEPAQAEPLLTESVALFRDIGDAWGAALATGKQGDAALAQGDYARAAACLEAALTVFRDRQDWRFVAGVLDGLGQLALARGDEPGARRAYAESLARSTALGDRTAIAWGLMGTAGVARLAERPARAARLLGAAAALREVVGAQLAPSEQAIHDRIETEARAAVGASRFAAEWEAGASLPLADAIAEATAMAGPYAVAEAPTARGRLASIDHHPPFLTVALTPRQREILRLIAEGLSNGEIAWQLRISPRTASNHVGAIFARLDVHTRQAAVRAASQLGLV